MHSRISFLCEGPLICLEGLPKHRDSIKGRWTMRISPKCSYLDKFSNGSTLVNNFPIFNRIVLVYLLITVWKVLKSSNHRNVYSGYMWKLKFHTTTLFGWKIESSNQLIIPCTSYLCIVIGLPIIFANFRTWPANFSSTHKVKGLLLASMWSYKH